MNNVTPYSAVTIQQGSSQTSNIPDEKSFSDD